MSVSLIVEEFVGSWFALLPNEAISEFAYHESQGRVNNVESSSHWGVRRCSVGHSGVAGLSVIGHDRIVTMARRRS